MSIKPQYFKELKLLKKLTLVILLVRLLKSKSLYFKLKHHQCHLYTHNTMW